MWLSDEELEMQASTWNYVAGPDDEENRGQIVCITKIEPGTYQKESITRLTVNVGVIFCYPN